MGEVRKALVRTNDPFLHQLSVWTVTDNDYEQALSVPARFVSYSLLRKPVEKIQAENTTDHTSAADETSQMSDSEPAPATAPASHTNPKRAKTEQPEVDMGSLIVCDDSETVPLTYVPCVNGVLKTGSVAVYGGQDCRVEQLHFDGRRKRAFAVLTSIEDEDITVRLPAVKVQLKSENFLKEEVVDFTQCDQHPINLAFATFSAIKRAAGLSRNKNSHSLTIGAATTLIRKFTGFTTNGHKEIVKFAVTVPDGTCGCPRSWDSVLGQRWDVLPATSANQLDTLVKTLRFTEYRDFGMFTIRCHINTCEGRYSNEENYRSLVIHNSLQASQNQYQEF